MQNPWGQVVMELVGSAGGEEERNVSPVNQAYGGCLGGKFCPTERLAQEACSCAPPCGHCSEDSGNHSRALAASPWELRP